MVSYSFYSSHPLACRRSTYISWSEQSLCRVSRPTTIWKGVLDTSFSFVSDIAAFEFKPFFIAGCTTTAINFALTVWAVHYSRYSAHSYGLNDDAKWRKTTSMLALFCGLWASVSFLLLAIFDTYRAHERHQYLLFSCFGGLGLAMLLTALVWFDQTREPSQWKRLRKW